MKMIGFKKLLICICALLFALSFCACAPETESAETVGGIWDLKDETPAPLWESTEVTMVEIALYNNIDEWSPPDPLNASPQTVVIEQQEDIQVLENVAVRMVKEGLNCNIGLEFPRYKVVFYGGDGTTQYYLIGPYVFCGDFTGMGNHIFTSETDLRDVGDGTAGEISIYREVRDIFNKYANYIT